MSTKRKLNTLSFEEKKRLIELFENSNKSKSAFAKAHNLPRTTLNCILSSKRALEEAVCKSNKKRMRKSKFDEIEKVLIRWLKHNRSLNVPISAVILKLKAKEIAQEMKMEGFCGSNGWVERFKERHDLFLKTVCIETAAETVENWKKGILLDILKKYDASNIFNLDEMGLFYRLLPDETLFFKGEKCTSGEYSKERLTLLLGANMSGNEKLKPLVIGKRRKPRCFENVKSLPVEYEANSNAWMTSTLWEKYIHELDCQFLRQKRKVAVVVDNCTVHSQPINLKAIEMVFLPPNVTTLLQPFEQGIMRDLKRRYKKMLVKDFIRCLDKNERLRVSVLDAVNYVHKSWNLVSEECIANCFRHAGFTTSNETEIPCENVDLEPLDFLLLEANENGCSIDVNGFVNIDDDLAICPEATIRNLTLEFLHVKEENFSSEDSDSEETYDPPNECETMDALDIVRSFLMSAEGTKDEEFQALSLLEKRVDSNN